MKYRFLLYLSHTYSIPIGKPLQDEILKRGDEVRWFSELDPPKSHFPQTGKLLSTVQDVMAYEPHIVLTMTNEVADFIPGLKVQVFHGFSAGKRSNKKGHFRIRGFFDLYCTQGPSTTSIFKKLEEKHRHFKVIETGWSKVDPLFPLRKEKLGSKPRIMIASTFTERLSLAYNEQVFEEVAKLSRTGNFDFEMVLHPKIPTTLVQKWKSLENENFRYHDTTDLIPIFERCHMLFADTTSAIQEFLVQKKPVVTFDHTYDHKYLIHVKEAREMENAFYKAMNPPAVLLKNIDEFVMNLHPYFDGESSSRVITASIDFLHEDKTAFKLKPLNLVRRYKVRKKLGYFTLRANREMPYLPSN